MLVWWLSSECMSVVNSLFFDNISTLFTIKWASATGIRYLLHFHPSKFLQNQSHSISIPANIWLVGTQEKVIGTRKTSRTCAVVWREDRFSFMTELIWPLVTWASYSPFPVSLRSYFFRWNRMCYRLRELQTTYRSVLWLIRVSEQNLLSNFCFICVGYPRCVGEGKTFTSVYYYINMRKSLSSATRPQIHAYLIELVELILNICMKVPESAY